MRLIDAEALFQIVKDYHDLYRGVMNPADKARRDECLQFMCDINDAQTVDAQPIVHGRWIETYGESWICSECGVESYVDEDWHRQDDKAYKMNFCHYCGAKMEAERK